MEAKVKVRTLDIGLATLCE